MQKITQKKKLQTVLEKEWQSLRKSFYYPQLPPPKLTDEVPNGQIDFKNLQVSINPDYIKKLAKKGCKERIALNALLAHELGHFVDYPASVLNLLRLHRIAKEDLDKRQASIAKEAFTNIQNNTNLILNRKYENIFTALKKEAIEAEGLNKIFFGLYQRLWKRKFGIKLNRKESKLVKKLQEIDYLDKEYQEQSFKEFVLAIRESLSEYRSLGQSPISMFSENQIKEGIKQFAKESRPGEFEKIVEEVLVEEKGMKAGTEKGSMMIAENFYTALAENFPIPIREKPLEKDGSLYPYSHEEFCIDDTIENLDPFSSRGIVPGITKKWIRKEGEVTKDYSGIPDSLIIIDSSGSMPNPDQNLSIPVLGATVIANAYLNNNTKVTVCNFSADNIIASLSQSKVKIHKLIRTYQGGGTVFSPPIVEDIIKKQENIDISIVSDMEINNLDDFVTYIANLPNVHRVHLFYTSSKKSGNITEKLMHKRNIAILPLISEKDIKSIAMGELRKSIK